MNQYSKSTNFLDDILVFFALLACPHTHTHTHTHCKWCVLLPALADAVLTLSTGSAHWTGAVCVSLFERSHGAVVGELGSLFPLFHRLLSAVSLPELGVQEPEKLVSGSFFKYPIMVGMPPLNDTWDNIPLLQDANLPVAFDWREQHPLCVHPVLNQGQCGSCWAFAASEVLSDRFCIASNGSTNVILSPGELLACEKLNLGCTMGSLPQWAFSYIQKNGVVSNACVPYIQVETGKPRSARPKVSAPIRRRRGTTPVITLNLTTTAAHF